MEERLSNEVELKSYFAKGGERGVFVRIEKGLQSSFVNPLARAIASIGHPDVSKVETMCAALHSNEEDMCLYLTSSRP